jgi:hypothetical protein
MNIEYEIRLDDLVRLHIALAQHRGGMSLWLHLLCAIILGPIGVLGLSEEVAHRLSTPFVQPTLSEIVLSLFCLLFFWLPFSLIWNCAWALRLRLARRIQNNPRLIGKRSLYLTPNRLLESTLHAMNDFVGADNKQAFVREHMFYSWQWSDLDTVKEDTRDIFLFAKSGPAIVIPIAGEPPAEVQAFREALMAHWHGAKSGDPLPSSEDIWPPAPRPY